MKLPVKVEAILEFYLADKSSEADFIFPEPRLADQTNPKDLFVKGRTADKKFNYYLAKIAEKVKIEKQVTMHIARHSFGNIAGDRISPQMLQKLYRHTSLTTTIGYQKNFIFKDADEALDMVIGF